MCGRFALDLSVSQMKSFTLIEPLSEVVPRYNIAPSQPILMLTQAAESSALSASWPTWGLLPFWAQDKKGLNLINARAETLMEKPAFKKAFQSRRGIVPMSGFFEWKLEGTLKQPYYFKKQDDAVMAIAAVYERWQDRAGQLVETCCLITTAANALMAPIHHRMPVILNQKAYSEWLKPNQCGSRELLNLLVPYPEADLTRYTVTAQMNSPRFDMIEAILPQHS